MQCLCGSYWQCENVLFLTYGIKSTEEIHILHTINLRRCCEVISSVYYTVQSFLLSTITSVYFVTCITGQMVSRCHQHFLFWICQWKVEEKLLFYSLKGTSKWLTALSLTIQTAIILTTYPHYHCFYYVKTNPKDIRRSCGQRVAPPAPSTPLARPLWPPLHLPGFWLPFHPPGCVWKSSWHTDSLHTSAEHYRPHIVYDMEPVIHLHS